MDIGLANQQRQQLDHRAGAEDRLDERLDHGQRAVVGARIAPALEKMRRRHHPPAVARGFVLIESQVDALRNTLDQWSDAERGRGCVARIAARADQCPHLAGAKRIHERGE